MTDHQDNALSSRMLTFLWGVVAGMMLMIVSMYLRGMNL